MRNFGMHARTALGGTERPSARHRANTPRDLNSSYRLPSQSILHGEDVPDSPLDVGAGSFVSLFLIVVAIACVGLYFFLRAIGL